MATRLQVGVPSPTLRYQGLCQATDNAMGVHDGDQVEVDLELGDAVRKE